MSISQTYQGGPPQPVAAPPPPVPMDLKTTRGADGSMTTTTPGAPSGGFGDPSALFQALIKHRLQNPAQQPVAPVAAPAPPRGTGAQIEQVQRTPAPTLGAAPVRPQRVTRQRRIRNKLSQPSWAGSLGDEWTTTSEYQLPDGSWSLDAVYGPNTPTGGR